MFEVHNGCFYLLCLSHSTSIWFKWIGLIMLAITKSIRSQEREIKELIARNIMCVCMCVCVFVTGKHHDRPNFQWTNIVINAAILPSLKHTHSHTIQFVFTLHLTSSRQCKHFDKIHNWELFCTRYIEIEILYTCMDGHVWEVRTIAYYCHGIGAQCRTHYMFIL